MRAGPLVRDCDQLYRFVRLRKGAQHQKSCVRVSNLYVFDRTRIFMHYCLHGDFVRHVGTYIDACGWVFVRDQYTVCAGQCACCTTTTVGRVHSRGCIRSIMDGFWYDSLPSDVYCKWRFRTLLPGSRTSLLTPALDWYLGRVPVSVDSG